MHSPLIIVGIGSQALAWALNLRDSNRPFKIALRANSSSISKAHEMGFEIVSLETMELSNYDTYLVLIPDDQHLSFLDKNARFFKPNSHFIYAHGYSLTRYQLINQLPNHRHSLLAPKAIASEVRFKYETKGKIGAIYFSENINDETFLKKLAENLGFTTLYKSHYREEMIADLFSEQTILCSLLPYASLHSYNLLVEKGISKELAFMECFLELRSIATALVNIGPEEFFKMISPNALVGSEKGQKILLDQDFKNKLHKIYDEIVNNSFYNEIDEKTDLYRKEVTERWSKTEFSKTYQLLKNELI